MRVGYPAPAAREGKSMGPPSEIPMTAGGHRLGFGLGLGLVLAAELLEAWPRVRVVLTCDTEPSNEILEICDDHDFELVKKPFITSQLLDFLSDRVIGVRSII